MPKPEQSEFLHKAEKTESFKNPEICKSLLIGGSKMTKKIVGVLAIVALIAVLAYTVFAANYNAEDNSEACNHASDTGKERSSDNSVLKSCQDCPDGDVLVVGGLCPVAPDGFEYILNPTAPNCCTLQQLP